MIGNIVLPNWYSGSGNSSIDEYFDYNFATESMFIKFLEAGIYTSDVIGYKVTLGNSVAYHTGTWIIADINHDSDNTGQTNCYDLISINAVANSNFGSTQYWRDSNPRSWLNNTFYSGFYDKFKSHIMNIKYNSNDSWYDDDKVLMPSYTEINGDANNSYTSQGHIVEGVTYNIFNRVDNCWTRSRVLANNSSLWCTGSSNRMGYKGGTNSAGYIAIIRVQ